MTLTYIQGLYGVLAELAQRPEYILPLRKELESISAKSRTTVEACDEMILLDSFLKECQRMHPPAAGMPIRRATGTWGRLGLTASPAVSAHRVCITALALSNG